MTRRMMEPLITSTITQNDDELKAMMRHVIQANFKRHKGLKRVLFSVLDDFNQADPSNKFYSFIRLSSLLMGARMVMDDRFSDDIGALNALSDALPCRWELHIKMREAVA